MRKILIIVFMILFGYAQPLALTSGEKQLLETHPLTCVSTGLWPPFNTIIEGELAGIGIDYWRKIAEKLDIPFKCAEAKDWTEVLNSIETKKYDLTIAADITPDRLKYAVFSESYVSYPYAIVTRDDVGFIYSPTLLDGKRIVAGKGFTIANVLKKYPNIDLVLVDSLDEALSLVEDGKAYAAIDALPVMAYMLNKNAFSTLKISGSLPEYFAPRIMVRKDYASQLPLINKAIASIATDEQNAINKQWINVKNNSLSSKIMKYLYGIIMVIVASAVYFYLKIFSLKKEIGNKENDLKHLKELASFDSLTLIYNRHMLDTILNQQLAIAQRYRQMLSVVFFDIDDFKAVNDTYGHNAGDDVLIELTRLVAGSLRGSDIFGRWGGDEFMIILPESSQRQAKRLVDILNTRIEEHAFSAVEHVSCSFGVVSHQFGDTLKDIVTRADGKLYEAKRIKKKSLKEI